MSPTRKCYQCSDGDLAEVQKARKEQILAHARQLQGDADKALRRELKKDEPLAVQADDYVLPTNTIPEEQPPSEATQDDTMTPMDALAAAPAQEDAETEKKVAKSPKPETQAPDSTRDEEDNRISANDAPAAKEAQKEVKEVEKEQAKTAAADEKAARKAEADAEKLAKK